MANNICEYPANKQQSMIYKSQSLLNSNSQNLSILHWPQQATPFENNQKVSTQTSYEQKNTWEEITYRKKTSQHVVILYYGNYDSHLIEEF